MKMKIKKEKELLSMSHSVEIDRNVHYARMNGDDVNDSYCCNCHDKVDVYLTVSDLKIFITDSLTGHKFS